jgi:muconolactone delta-isomerase
MQPGSYEIHIMFDADDVDTAIALHDIIQSIAPWMVDNVEVMISSVEDV